MSTSLRSAPRAAARPVFVPTAPRRRTALLADPERPLALLDAVAAHFDAGEVADGMAMIHAGLRTLRAAMPAAEWQAFATDACRRHPVMRQLREDPLTRRCQDRPRGYAGDAATLDLIYRGLLLPEDTTALGRAIHGYVVEAPACRAVRYRRDLLARTLDATAARVADARGEGARVLSVACGHLREATASAAVRDGRIAFLGALDQDPLSLAEVVRTHADRAVTPVPGAVRDLLAGTIAIDDLDLAYAAGLYDYLPLPIACRLTARLFTMVRPGGRVLVANFCPDLMDAAYMEACMDWPLLWRDEADMHAIADAVPAAAVAARRVWRDPAGAVVYLELVRG